MTGRSGAWVRTATGTNVRDGHGRKKPARRRGTDGAELTGSTEQSNSRCRGQDRTLLSTSSSTPRARRRTTRRRTDEIRPTSRLIHVRTSAKPGQSARVISVLVSAVLVGLTSGAIASVSPWLVAFYATAMVLIFALPRTTDPEDNLNENQAAPTDQKSRMNHGPGHAFAKTRPTRPANERGTAEISTPGSAAADSAPTPPRRTRHRARKGVKPAPEPVPQQLQPGFRSRRASSSAPTRRYPRPPRHPSLTPPSTQWNHPRGS